MRPWSSPVCVRYFPHGEQCCTVASHGILGGQAKQPKLTNPDTLCISSRIRHENMEASSPFHDKHDIGYKYVSISSKTLHLDLHSSGSRTTTTVFDIRTTVANPQVCFVAEEGLRPPDPKCPSASTARRIRAHAKPVMKPGWRFQAYDSGGCFNTHLMHRTSYLFLTMTCLY